VLEKASLSLSGKKRELQVELHQYWIEAHLPSGVRDKGDFV